MLFNTVQYLLFLPVVVLIYYLLPYYVRYIWLLISSYYFYMQWNPAYVLLLFLSTLVTYIGALVMEYQKCKCSTNKNYFSYVHKKQKICLIVCIIFNLCILGIYKYTNFIIDCINLFLSYFHIGQFHIEFNILLPVGISFYTLQALGYLIDVYRGELFAEKNFLKYALFVSFFPQLVAGPIERSRNLLGQLQEHHSFQFYNIKKGVLIIIYGLFLKMVIGDRLSVIVDRVFLNTERFSGFYIVIAVALFSVQIYCDFYGYSTIAKGSALLMGIHLMDNFIAPYYSKSIKEFWRRWHISLSSWFRDYLYIPLGGNRKGFKRKEINILLIFAISGLWHGASWGYVFWGILHALYQIIAGVLVEVRNHLSGICGKIIPKTIRYCEKIEGTKTFSIHLYQQISTYLLVSFAWLFFRAGSFSASIQIIEKMLRGGGKKLDYPVRWVVI